MTNATTSSSTSARSSSSSSLSSGDRSTPDHSTNRVDLTRRLPGAYAWLTQFVERLSRRPYGHPDGVYNCAFVGAGRFVANLIERADCAAHAVRARQLLDGTIVLETRIRADAPPELKPGTIQPVAVIECGPTLAEVQGALQVLAERERRQGVAA